MLFVRTLYMLNILETEIDLMIKGLRITIYLMSRFRYTFFRKTFFFSIQLFVKILYANSNKL